MPSARSSPDEDGLHEARISLSETRNPRLARYDVAVGGLDWANIAEFIVAGFVFFHSFAGALCGFIRIMLHTPMRRFRLGSAYCCLIFIQPICWSVSGLIGNSCHLCLPLSVRDDLAVRAVVCLGLRM
jgi:hypothetical protein